MANKFLDAKEQFFQAKTKLSKIYGVNNYVVLEAEAFTAIAESNLGNIDNALKKFDVIMPNLLEKWHARMPLPTCLRSPHLFN